MNCRTMDSTARGTTLGDEKSARVATSGHVYCWRGMSGICSNLGLLMVGLDES